MKWYFFFHFLYNNSCLIFTTLWLLCVVYFSKFGYKRQILTSIFAKNLIYQAVLVLPGNQSHAQGPLLCYLPFSLSHFLRLLASAGDTFLGTLLFQLLLSFHLKIKCTHFLCMRNIRYAWVIVLQVKVNAYTCYIVSQI